MVGAAVQGCNRSGVSSCDNKDHLLRCGNGGRAEAMFKRMGGRYSSKGAR